MIIKNSFIMWNRIQINPYVFEMILQLLCANDCSGNAASSCKHQIQTIRFSNSVKSGIGTKARSKISLCPFCKGGFEPLFHKEGQGRFSNRPPHSTSSVTKFFS